MQTLELLIEENSFGAVRPVEVAADVPVGLLVPALVKELQLPQNDLFGKKLVYTLRRSSDMRVLPAYTTLSAYGIMPGTKLALDSEATTSADSSGSNSARTLQAGIAGMPTIPPIPQSPAGIAGMPTIPPIPQSPAGIANMPTIPPSSSPRMPAVPASPYVQSLGLHTSDTIADFSAFPVLGGNDTPVPGYASVKKRKGRGTRRAFLLAGVLALGAGGTALGYVGYQRFIVGAAKPAPVKKPIVGPVKPVPQPQVPTKATALFTFMRHTQVVRTVAWSHDGMRLASGADDSQVFVWDAAGKVQQQFAHPGSVRAVSWSIDGIRLMTGAGTQIAFYDVQTGKALAKVARAHAANVTSVSWTAQNMQQGVSGGNDMHAVVWDTKTYQPQRTFAKHNAPIESVAWANDGQTVASSSQLGAVRVWNAENGIELHGYYQDAQVRMRSLAFSPQNMMLAVGSEDGVVRLWNNAGVCQQQVQMNGVLRCTDMPQRLMVSKKVIRTLAWSPDGRFLATGGDDGMLAVWYPTQGQMQGQKPLLTVPMNVAIHGLAWNPSGMQLAVAAGNNVVLYKLA